MSEHLDENGELAPPWARFPDYERYSIGWRMGAGEDWLGLWRVFLEQLPKDHSARLQYLKRHPVAPVNWADHVELVLSLSSEDDDDPEPTQARLVQLQELGLIGSDVAFEAWLRVKPESLHWPWADWDTPELAARHATRPFWFWSRQVAQNRQSVGPLDLPSRWKVCEHPLTSGAVPTLKPEHGLKTLAILLCAGIVIPPWRIGLHLGDFADSFEEDMAYVDAFRLWAISCFDDATHLRRYCDEFDAPPPWRTWLTEQCCFTHET